MRRWAALNRRLKIVFALLTAVTAAVLVLLVAGPIPWVSPDVQSAWAATLQAIGLVGTLLFAAQGIRVAAETLESDRRDRRVDRVLAFHEELIAGPTGEARSRLARLLREKGGPDGAVLQVSKQQLSDDPMLQKYPEEHGAAADATPRRDLTLILRLFERVHIAHEAELLDEHLLAVLIGRHAGWWDLAIAEEEDTARRALKRLATWSDGYPGAQEDHPDLENWGQSRKIAFPHGHISAAPPATIEASVVVPTPATPPTT